jgi:hypothetical protein
MKMVSETLPKLFELDANKHTHTLRSLVAPLESGIALSVAHAELVWRVVPRWLRFSGDPALLPLHEQTNERTNERIHR